MGIFDNFGRSAQESWRGVNQRAKDGSEISRLNHQISDNNNRINQLYAEMGKLYCQLHPEDAEPQLARYVSSIQEMETRNREWNDQIQALRGLRKCPHCGAWISKTVTFCVNCGQRAIPEHVTLCPRCGSQAPEGTLFCPQCGERLPDNSAGGAASTRRCSRCGTEAEEGMRFCINCGSPLEVVPTEPVGTPPEQPPQPTNCPSCGAEVPPNGMFCPSCGCPLNDNGG
ncbi:MAG: zinc ribbon domain-containing protein [Oscillospiraceae bacterium]|nr:zinc ribbon domain-containing protein [Oscillospiraceae bacterium]